MASSKEKRNIDSILTFVLLKKIVTPITKTDAFKLGLVNNVGRVIKKPETDEEKDSLTLLDRFTFKLRRLLGSKLNQLHNFFFLQTLGNSFQNKLVVRGSVEQRAEIKRISRDLEKLSESYGYTIEEVLKLMMNEKLRNVKEDQNVI